jgi:soluble lytic murein transglycosylase-like protein
MSHQHQNVMLFGDNKRMKKMLFVLLSLSITFGVRLAHADVLVDLARDDEISISNTAPDGRYTLKLTEPVEVTATENLPAVKKRRGHALAQSNPALLPYHHDVLFAASQTALEPALIHAVITVESKHNANAVSRKGAVGLMQLMPATAMRFNATDKHNTKQHILAGAQYLRTLLDQFDGNLSLGLAAYNAGPGAVRKYQYQIPPYKETQHYVPTVLQYYRSYSQG